VERGRERKEWLEKEIKRRNGEEDEEEGSWEWEGGAKVDLRELQLRNCSPTHFCRSKMGRHRKVGLGRGNRKGKKRE